MTRLVRCAPVLVSIGLLVPPGCGPEVASDPTVLGQVGGGEGFGPPYGEGKEYIRPGDPCDDYGATQICGEDNASFMYCDTIAGETVWGPCLYAPDCVPGETEDWDCDWGGEYVCELDDGVPTWEDWCEETPDGDTPLVIVFGDAPVEYAPVSGASFDTFDGGCRSHDWPTAATPWLVLDRDGSGFIENGRELFGSGTRLRDGRRARNGFEALAELDGNHDGVVSALDPAYHDLLVWQDTDGDRVSRPGELLPVANLGLTELPVAFDTHPTCDARGNCEVERAPAGTVSGVAASVVDVHLACY